MVLSVLKWGTRRRGKLYSNCARGKWRLSASGFGQEQTPVRLLGEVRGPSFSCWGWLQRVLALLSVADHRIVGDPAIAAGDEVVHLPLLYLAHQPVILVRGDLPLPSDPGYLFGAY